MATRAVKLLSDFGLDELQLKRLEIRTEVDNLASQAVAEKAGFTREGVLRSAANIGEADATWCSTRGYRTSSWVEPDSDASASGTADAQAIRRAERERHVLRGIESTDLPAPLVLAFDPTGESTGVPALLMTRVPGRVDLTPTDPKGWLRQIVAMAVRIHELDVDAEPYRGEARDVPVPPWASRPADWRAAADVVRGPARRLLVRRPRHPPAPRRGR